MPYSRNNGHCLLNEIRTLLVPLYIKIAIYFKINISTKTWFNSFKLSKSTSQLGFGKQEGYNYYQQQKAVVHRIIIYPSVISVFVGEKRALFINFLLLTQKDPEKFRNTEIKQPLKCR